MVVIVITALCQYNKSSDHNGDHCIHRVQMDSCETEVALLWSDVAVMLILGNYTPSSSLFPHQRYIPLMGDNMQLRELDVLLDGHDSGIISLSMVLNVTRASGIE